MSILFHFFVSFNVNTYFCNNLLQLNTRRTQAGK